MTSHCPDEGLAPSKQRDRGDEILKILAVPAAWGVPSVTQCSWRGCVFGARYGSSTLIEILPFPSQTDYASQEFVSLQTPLRPCLLLFLWFPLPTPTSAACSAGAFGVTQTFQPCAGQWPSSFLLFLTVSFGTVPLHPPPHSHRPTLLPSLEFPPADGSMEGALGMIRAPL